MGDIKKVPVKIRGREYRVSCTEEEEYIEKLSYYLEKKLNQVINSNGSLDTLDATTLVALNLVDDLFRAVKIIERMAGKSNIKIDFSDYSEIEKIQKEGIPEEVSEKPLHN